MNGLEEREDALKTEPDGFGDADTEAAAASDNAAQGLIDSDIEAADATASSDAAPTPEPKAEVDPTTLYDPITNRVRLLIARDIDPTDKVRVYIRIIVVAGILYYIGTGVWGILMG